jgi:hypothetical protein
MRLDRELYAQIRHQFSDNLVREILLASAGVKMSRTCLSDAKLRCLRVFARRHGFYVVAGRERYVHYRDRGKGGWSNSFRRIAGSPKGIGRRNVYIASERSIAEEGRLAEEANNEDILGRLLGIPVCCREAYLEFQRAASAKQNDFVPLVLENTLGPMPYDCWVNYVANYFGRALLSFFPCSFRCGAAYATAKRTFELLAECDDAWAQSFWVLQRTNILYTEYDGLHMFRRPLVDGWIYYGPSDMDSTEPTDVADLIRRGDRLEVHGKRRVNIYHAKERIGALEGEDVSMCVFW